MIRSRGMQWLQDTHSSIHTQYQEPVFLLPFSQGMKGREA